MALAYTAPTWSDGSGEGISASNLQAISNCIEGLVQGTDKAVHSISIANNTITMTFADGTHETATVEDMKGVASVELISTVGTAKTYRMTFTDGTYYDYVVNDGTHGTDGRDGVIQYTAGTGINISAQNEISADVDEWTDAVTASTSGSDTVAIFDDLDDDYGYDLYCEDELVGVTAMNKGTGTNTGIKLTFTLSGATSGTTVCYLRILK